MDESIQLFSFFASFVFGFLIFFCTQFHFSVCSKLSIFMQYLYTFIYMIDIALLYVLLLYHINNGVVHVYFLIVFGIGFFSALFLQKNVKLTDKLSSVLAKKKEK